MGELAQTKQTDQATYQHAEAVDVEEIEIFSSGNRFSNLPASSQQRTSNLPAGLSIKDAAKVLGVSVNTIRSRIKSGELAAEKIKGPTNEQWRVFIGNSPASSQQRTIQQPEFIESPTNREIHRLLDIVEAQTAKLEAASMQVGYYKAQWEASQEAIKLLTDSQHKVSFWRKAWRWFIGRNG